MEYSEDNITFLGKIFDEVITNFGKKNELTDKAYTQLLDYFDRKRNAFDVP